MVLFCIVALSALFQPSHFLNNLEPYPDGMLYALSARNLAMGRGMQLVYQDSEIKHWVPLLYTLKLMPSYLVSKNPNSFVVINTLLGAVTIGLLGWIVWYNSRNLWAVGFTLLIYLSHAFILWLPSLPMSENLSVMLLVLGIAGLILGKDKRWVGVSIALIAAVGLVFTRYAAVPIAGTLSILALLQLRKSINTGRALIMGAVILIAITLFSWLVTNPLVLLNDLIVNIFSGNSPFYSARFLLPNVVGYFKPLLGFPAQFLWQHTSFTSFFAVFWLLALPILAWKFKRYKYESIVVISLFLAQFPLMLVFYTLDTRYIIYTLPLVALAAGWSVALLHKKVPTVWLLTGIGLVLLAHSFTQISMYKQLVAANLLGRTVSWQTEAIKHFDQSLSGEPKGAFVITALPPFLVDAYTTAHYRVLPLSPSQEFIAKGEWVWGSDTKPVKDSSDFSMQHLFAEIDELLLAGNPVFISNAYITHLHEVTKDYELFKARYTLELTSEGCQNACDLYRVR